MHLLKPVDQLEPVAPAGIQRRIGEDRFDIARRRAELARQGIAHEHDIVLRVEPDHRQGDPVIGLCVTGRRVRRGGFLQPPQQDGLRGFEHRKLHHLVAHHAHFPGMAEHRCAAAQIRDQLARIGEERRQEVGQFFRGVEAIQHLGFGVAPS